MSDLPIIPGVRNRPSLSHDPVQREIARLRQALADVGIMAKTLQHHPERLNQRMADLMVKIIGDALSR